MRTGYIRDAAERLERLASRDGMPVNAFVVRESEVVNALCSIVRRGVMPAGAADGALARWWSSGSAATEDRGIARSGGLRCEVIAPQS